MRHYRNAVLTVEKVLVFLLDGTWHELSEIADNLQIERQTLDKAVKLLLEFNFVQTSKSKVRIDSDTKEFLMSVNNGLKP